jgi:RND family efflux transporter MFP subunit
VQIASKVTGRITMLNVREGTPVKSGQVLVQIDPAQVQDMVLQQQAAVAEARSKLAQAQLGQGANSVSVKSQINQQQAQVASDQASLNQVTQNYKANVSTAQAGVDDAQAKLRSAKVGVDNAQANLQSAQANLANARAHYNRESSLYEKQYVAKQDVEDAQAQVAVQEANVKVAQGQISAANAFQDSADQALKATQNQLSIAQTTGRADIQAAKAKVKQSKAALEVANANTSQEPAYKANLEALQAGVDAAEAQLRQAQSQLGDTTITAPIDGTVTARTADPGSIASPGEQLLSVAFLQWVFASTSVPVEDSGVIVKGMSVSIEFDAIPGETFHGTVSEINPSADPQSRQFTVRVRLENPGGRLVPGMYAKFAFATQNVHADAYVPREAVKTNKDGSVHVFVVGSDNLAHDTEVKLGAADSEGYQIVSGVKPGDKVVTLAYQPLKDGQKVSESGGKGKGGGGGRGRKGSG